jgi:hypothetical protein
MREFFEGKKCVLCGKPATFFRFIGKKQYFLCVSKECDLRTRENNGFGTRLDFKIKE